MTSAASNPACAAFDHIAPTYDEVFTRSNIGRAQRDVVWKQIDNVWKPGDRILELNCGTGEDALYLASRGIGVVACDGSSRMIEIARRRQQLVSPAPDIQFVELTTEQVNTAFCGEQFDGALSNFSGFNCLTELNSVAAALAPLVRPHGEVLLCLSTRFCAWEFFWFGVRLRLSQAVRRWFGHAVATVGGNNVEVWYPTLRGVRASFSPLFSLEDATGVGVFIPPSYAESFVVSHPLLFRFLCWLDARSNRLPGLRVSGDHMLLRFRRSGT